MSFVYDANGIAQRDFGRPEDFKNWILAQTQRVRKYFPKAVAKLAELGPLVFSRWSTDTPDVIVEKLHKALTELVAWRVGLDPDLPITQLEAVDDETRMTHQWNIAPRAVFDKIDVLRSQEIGRDGAPASGLGAELAAISNRLAVLGLSTQLEVSRHAGAARFSGFCPVCDGVLQTTSTRIDDKTHALVLWEEQCFACARRSIVWKAGWQRARPAAG